MNEGNGYDNNLDVITSQPLQLTISADEILDVTPVHSRSPSTPDFVTCSERRKINDDARNEIFSDEDWETDQIESTEKSSHHSIAGVQPQQRRLDEKHHDKLQHDAAKSMQSFEDGSIEPLSSRMSESMISGVQRSGMTYSSGESNAEASPIAFKIDSSLRLHEFNDDRSDDSSDDNIISDARKCIGEYDDKAIEDCDSDHDTRSRVSHILFDDDDSQADSRSFSDSGTKNNASILHKGIPKRAVANVSKTSALDHKLSSLVGSSINLSNSSDGFSSAINHDEQKYGRNDDDNSSVGSGCISESSNASMSEWDKASQIGRSFSGKADAKTFAQNHLKKRVGTSQHRLGSSSARNHPKLNAVPEESDFNQPTSISKATTTNELSTEEKTILHDKKEAVKVTVHEASVPAPVVSNQESNPTPTPVSQNHLQLPPPAVLRTYSSQSAQSDHSALSAKILNSGTSIATSQFSPSRSLVNPYHYPLTLQHQSRQLDQRRTSGSSVTSNSSAVSGGIGTRNGVGGGGSVASAYSHNANDHLSAGVLPDVLMTVRQKIESMSLFDSDIMRLVSSDYSQMAGPRNSSGNHHDDDPSMQESRELLKRSSQQSISAAVLVSLAHKRYERRRLAAMEIEKVVRSLVAQHQQNQDLSNNQKSQYSAAVVKRTSAKSPSFGGGNDVALDRIRAILLLLSDDYVRSTSEDARKGGVVALAACAIGLKKADESISTVQECRDIILASVVHACQDHSQRVRYYATESLFNVVKVLPALAVQHFFILFEILRSLYADVDVDVRSGAELLDKKLKEIIVGAMNAGIFTADACVPVFSRFVFMKHKVTKRLTLTWLQELNEKLIGSSHTILEFLHLFLTGIFNMVADPSVAIRQSALAFLQSVLPKLLVVNNGNQSSQHDNMIINNTTATSGHGGNTTGASNSMFDSLEDVEMNVVDFDKILQSLVTTMENPNPFVRKVAMYWVSRIVRAHMTTASTTAPKTPITGGESKSIENRGLHDASLPITPRTDAHEGNPGTHHLSFAEKSNSRSLSRSGDVTKVSSSSTSISAASQSVRNSVPHVLPGILLCIGDSFHHSNNTANSVVSAPKDTFLPDQTTRDLAEQANACLQEAVRSDGAAYVQHLDGFIVALREELDSPVGFHAVKCSPAVYRTPYRMDVVTDGTGIETAGWFRSSREDFSSNPPTTTEPERSVDDGVVQSRLCALHWIIVLYEYVVPDPLKADFAKVFILAIIHQLADNPPQIIVRKSLEVLAKITVPVHGEMKHRRIGSNPMNSVYCSPAWNASTVSRTNTEYYEDHSDSPMSDDNVNFAMNILDESSRLLISRDREVFSSLVQLFSFNEHLVADLSNVLTYMCRLQPPAFVMVSFAVELERFIKRRQHAASNLTCNVKVQGTSTLGSSKSSENLDVRFSRDLRFVSSFIQHMNHVFFNKDEAKELRTAIKDCVGPSVNKKREFVTKDRQRLRLFSILLHSFSHNLAATLSLCLWSGAYRTAYLFLTNINPLDINLMFLLEVDRLVEMLERPLFRYIQVRMLERDRDVKDEGSGAMLFQFLKCVLMLLPQSTCYRILRDRLASLARFRQSTHISPPEIAMHDKGSIQSRPDTQDYVSRIREVRELHCEAAWKSIRQGSLEVNVGYQDDSFEEGSDRRSWLGYDSKEAEEDAAKLFRKEKNEGLNNQSRFEELKHDSYQDINGVSDFKGADFLSNETSNEDGKLDDFDTNRWINFWTGSNN